MTHGSQLEIVFFRLLRLFAANSMSPFTSLQGFSPRWAWVQVGIQCLGAAVVVVTDAVPDWAAGYEGGNVGGLLEAMLHPVGKFGKFLTVLLSLSVAANIAATFYSISINIQVFIPVLVAVPRYVFSIVATAMSVFS